MARTELDRRTTTRTVTEEQVLEVVNDPSGTEYITKNGKAIAGDSPDVLGMYCKILLQEDLRNKSIAILGGGTFVLARLIKPYNITKCDVYELEPSIINWGRNKYGPFGAKINIIQGDYHTTLTGLYDLIIYNVSDDVVDEEFLNSHLNLSGKVIIL